MEKYEIDGSVVVLVSRGFGAGWSTWNTDVFEQLAMDKRIVEYVLLDPHRERRESEVQEFLESIGLSSVYCGGYEDLEIVMVEKGMYFEINEYDGSETLNIITDMSEFTRA
ncbi:hypothetical protein KQI33_14875 [Enterococcus devriesei]|uniref:hypothetical protein n=1 Tax=Enterococcus devriesei TaxID=319970 RepID=UPI001C0FB971|nr:hypothetical protein [Enterococcus devriesei]MBU5366663.1 hypothetical protein [Enterococcus devriesei]